MKKNIGFCDFVDSFRDAGRENDFTYDGLTALYEWLTELEDSMGEEMELDVIALCCDFTEYDSILECVENYLDFEWDGEQDEEENIERAREYLNDNTQLIEFEGGVIIQNF